MIPSLTLSLHHLSQLISFYPMSANHRDLHSFPTRRSSDLEAEKQRDHLHRAEALKLLGRFDDAIAAYRRSDDPAAEEGDRKSTRLNSSHVSISYAVFCLKKKTRRGSG